MRQQAEDEKGGRPADCASLAKPGVVAPAVWSISAVAAIGKDNVPIVVEVHRILIFQCLENVGKLVLQEGVDFLLE